MAGSLYPTPVQGTTCQAYIITAPNGGSLKSMQGLHLSCRIIGGVQWAGCETAGRTTMATYVVLAKFTDQGIRNAKDSPKRAEAFKQMAETFGVTVKELFWTQGRYDIVTIVEAPDEISATALNLSISALGNVRTELLRAFSAAEMMTIVNKMI
jgi:uncharacterized protein with GYD domain